MLSLWRVYNNSLEEEQPAQEGMPKEQPAVKVQHVPQVTLPGKTGGYNPKPIGLYWGIYWDYIGFILGLYWGSQKSVLPRNAAIGTLVGNAGVPVNYGNYAPGI